MSQQHPQWARPQWPEQSRRRRRVLPAVLIALWAAVVFVLSFGAVLIFQQYNSTQLGQPQVTSPPLPPSSSPAGPTDEPRVPTLAPPPPTSRPTPSQPPTSSATSAAPTAAKSTKPATTTRPPTAKPNKPTKPSKPATTAGPAKPPTTKQPTAQPSKKPAKLPKGGDEPTLINNKLYRQQLKASACSRQPGPVPTTTKAYRKYIDQVLTCLQAAYAGPLSRAGYKLDKPPLMIYTSSVETPCGQSPPGYAVFYCGANETIYATKDALDSYTTMRLGLFYVLFHEYAHHVQERTGILNASYLREEDSLVVSRRTELQAECLMGMTLRSVGSVGYNGTDQREMVVWRNAVPDDIHGTSKSQLFWIDRGLKTTDFGRCSTWLASTKRVR
ncbi:hypothetical protein GCM10009841_10290 [Microlunatus panaciterrae]|uniref:Metalloprotease n=1 Tax=Microlunatus panaciterrae TaxID=400768 RepID=A0ABS2RKR0_9ACTN|nr:neutral zinc metallopeptidase [Microlunatus panaciterrae]MBM7799577.1 putative metalloprotease [Microlunatus panaciterrae]